MSTWTPSLSLVASFRNKVGLSGPGGIWKLLAILFALLNLKSLPFSWHLRILKSFLTHTRSSRVRLASNAGPSALFQPMITTSRSGFLECDYNLHKSNSSYFTDFDIARMETLVCLAGSGAEKTRQELAREMGTKERFGIMLGGVSCNFRREIKPYEGYEIWTRLLSWDQKWFYGVSHFVKKGAVRPEGYTLQPWRKSKSKGSKGSKNSANEGDTKPGPHPAIFASGIAKYVFKKGRLTIPPERVFQAAGLLPPRPADTETPPTSITPDLNSTSVDAEIISTAEKLTTDNAGEMLAASLTPTRNDGEWTWERVEEERLRGLKVAHMFNGLDMLNEEFMYDGKPALGQY